MLRWALGIPTGHSDLEAQMGICHSTGAFRLRVLRWALGISPEHSNQMLMCIDHSTGTFRFLMLRWAMSIPPEDTDLECSDGHWKFHLGIQISNSQMGIGPSR